MAQENLADLVTRLRTQKWASRREADRATKIPYATWQNIELRGTIPRLPTLTKIADALGIDEIDLVRAAHITQIEKKEDEQ